LASGTSEPGRPDDDQPRLKRLTPSALSPEQRALYDTIARGPRTHAVAPDGHLRGPFNAMLYSPRIGKHLQALGAAIRFESSLEPRARELAILTVAVLMASGYEWMAHKPIARRLGLTEQDLASIHSDSLGETITPTEGTIIRLARALVTHGDLSDQEYAEAEQALGPAAILELSTLVGYYWLLAVQLRIFRVSDRE
jgi:4-carboxymuconolactone decarboxylase